jgi:transposase
LVLHPNSRWGHRARIRKEGFFTMSLNSNAAYTQATNIVWGIDVAAAKLDLARHDQAQVHTYDNSPAGIALLCDQIRQQPATAIVVEATGGYETPLVVALAAEGLPVVVINPRQLRAFATAVGQLAKTDAIDARLIARFAHDVRPPLRPIPEEKQRLFADLAARRRQLITLRTAELNRRQQQTRPELTASIDAVLLVLHQQIELLEEQMAQLIADDEQWTARDAILQSVSGVGPATSHALIADLPELGTIEHKQIAKLVGLAPLNRDSGKLRGRRTIVGGRATVRCALYMATFNAVRCNHQLRTFYQRLRAAGKPYKLAITACMRKLLTILNALVRDHTPWRNSTMNP